jgi:predicted unusual protein kinase regulating ubiquinone biosynthesis (AarF/ABC1/UbiB family)
MAKFPLHRFFVVAYKVGPTLLRFAFYRKTHRDREATPKEKEKLAKQGKTLYQACVDLGPAFIKLGQILSVRPDLLPPEYIKELEKLQDDVPPADFDSVRTIIEEDLGPIDRVFDEFDVNAIASASLGQVYKAKYRGVDVAVKVNRPRVKELVEQDSAVLKFLLRFVGVFVDQNVEYSFVSVVEEYIKRVKEEINYIQEAKNMEYLAKELQGQEVIVPRVFKEVSSNRVLVMSYHGGVKVTDIEKLDKLGVDRPRLARRLARVFLTMVLEKEFFHADPHPGNIAVHSGGVLVLYDYGMVGSLDDYTKKHLIRMYAAFSLRDAKGIVEELLALGALDPSANRMVVERGFELAIRELKGENVSEWEFRQLRELANRLIYRFPFKLPPDLVLYMRMAALLEAVCMKLDEDFSFLKVVVKLLQDKGYLDEVRRDNIRAFVDSLLETALLFGKTAPLILKRLSEPDSNNHRGAPKKTLVLPSVIIFGFSLYGAYTGFLRLEYAALGVVFGFALLVFQTLKS